MHVEYIKSYMHCTKYTSTTPHNTRAVLRIIGRLGLQQWRRVGAAVAHRYILLNYITYVYTGLHARLTLGPSSSTIRTRRAICHV